VRLIILDGQLERTAASTVAAHISRCTDCARLGGVLAITIAALARVGPCS
jgi:anti-sigma factor RsiW